MEIIDFFTVVPACCLVMRTYISIWHLRGDARPFSCLLSYQQVAWYQVYTCLNRSMLASTKLRETHWQSLDDCWSEHELCRTEQLNITRFAVMMSASMTLAATKTSVIVTHSVTASSIKHSGTTAPPKKRYAFILFIISRSCGVNSVRAYIASMVLICNVHCKLVPYSTQSCKEPIFMMPWNLSANHSQNRLIFIFVAYSSTYSWNALKPRVHMLEEGGKTYFKGLRYLQGGVGVNLRTIGH